MKARVVINAALDHPMVTATIIPTAAGFIVTAAGVCNWLRDPSEEALSTIYFGLGFLSFPLPLFIVSCIQSVKEDRAQYNLL